MTGLPANKMLTRIRNGKVFGFNHLVLFRLIVLRSRSLSRLFGKTYFGLGKLDEKILNYVDYKNGYFVELGANDGVVQSNTKHFELYKGWRGVLIEPTPNQFSKLTKFRSKRSQFYNCACVSFDFPKKTIELVYSNLMSVALEGRNEIKNPLEHAKSGEIHLGSETVFTFTAEARTLQSILDESKSPRLIDLLSLDVEGGELEVLRGIDFKRTNFRFIVVETDSINQVRSFLEGHKYQQINQLSHHDYIFKWLSS